MSPPLVKICGLTSAADARLAQAAGADYVGAIIEHTASPRSVTAAQARLIFAEVHLPTVAVTVNRSRDALLHLHQTLQPSVLQLHGDEALDTMRDLVAAGCRVWAACSGDAEHARHRAAEARAAGVEALLIDARAMEHGVTIYGGTGLRADWDLAREQALEGGRVVLAGGLNPDNVANAVAEVRPWMVDVVSGVEAAPGVKDEAALRCFIAASHNPPPLPDSDSENAP
jgi:phosphoribosylanthranilate isomerase